MLTDRFDLVPQGPEATARHRLDRFPGCLGHSEVAEIAADAGPEFPFEFGQNVAGIGECRASEQVDRAADVVGVGVGEDHRVDISGPDAGHFQPRLDRTAGAGVFAGPGIDQHDVSTGLDQQAGVRAQHGVLGQVMTLQRLAQFGGIGVRKEPRRRVRIIAVAENCAGNGSDLEAIRALWHM
jgi:hypothetical protein